MLWQGFLISILIHLLLLIIPIQVNTTRVPPREELQLIFMASAPQEQDSGVEEPPPPQAVAQESPPEEPPAEELPPEPPPPEEPLPEVPAREVPKPPTPKREKTVRKPPTSPKPRTVEPRHTPSVFEGEGKPEAVDSPPPPTSQEKREHVGPIETAFGTRDGPKFLKRILPRYPRLARELGKEGTVVLRLHIDAQGRLTSVQVVQKAGSGFDEEAVRAVKSSTFTPAKRDGKAVASIALLSIRFMLKE